MRNGAVTTHTYGVDERVTHGATSKVGPVLDHLPGWEKASQFKLGSRFLPVKYLLALAESMDSAGKAKYDKGHKNYVNWRVTLDDVLQWIGVWLHMLAKFPMLGDRSLYWRNRLSCLAPGTCLKKIAER
eukprot:6198987-Pleurochrysis_carterae.AAC.5